MYYINKGIFDVSDASLHVIPILFYATVFCSETGSSFDLLLFLWLNNKLQGLVVASQTCFSAWNSANILLGIYVQSQKGREQDVLCFL